jgi:hypothetical protein
MRNGNVNFQQAMVVGVYTDNPADLLNTLSNAQYIYY